MTDGSTPEPAQLRAPAPPERRRHLFCFAAIVALVALDLWSKSAAFEFLDRATLVRDDTGHDRYPLLGNWFGLMRNLNYGAAFGQLKGIPTILVVLRAVAVVLLSVLIVRTPRGQGIYLAALVLILAGAAGNLYDNLFHRPPDHNLERPFGPVRDFIDVYFTGFQWHFPTFNVADSCITVGAVLLLLSGLIGSPSEATLAGAEGDSVSAAEPTATPSATDEPVAERGGEGPDGAAPPGGAVS